MRPRSNSTLGPVTLNVTQTVVKVALDLNLANLFQAGSCAPVQILLISLQNYICTSDPTGVHAKGALFELIHLLSSDPESTDLLIQDPTFKNVMVY